MERTELNLPIWFQKALSNPEVTDLCLNGIHSAYLDQGEGLKALIHSDTEKFRDNQLRDWVLMALSEAGKTWDAKYPFVDAGTDVFRHPAAKSAATMHSVKEARSFIAY